jgi:hypothetical protein
MPNSNNSKEKETLSADEMNFRNSVVAKLTALQRESSKIKESISNSKTKKGEAKRKVGSASSGIAGLQGLKKLGSSAIED